MEHETTTPAGQPDEDMAAIERKLAEVLTTGKRADLRVLAEMGESGVTTDHLCHSGWLQGAMLAELVTTPGGERVRLTAKGRRVVGYLEDASASSSELGQVASSAAGFGPYPGYEPGELDRGELGRIASALERLCVLFDVGPRDEPSSRWTDPDYTPSRDGDAYGGFPLAQAFQEWARRIEWSSAAWSELTEPERRDYVAIVTGIEDRADEIRRGGSASRSGTGYEHSTMAAGARPLVGDDESCCAADDMARRVEGEPGHSAWCAHDTHPHGAECVVGCACGRGKVSNR